MNKSNVDLNRLNCMNYQVHDAEGDYWYAQNGLRSIYTYSKCTDVPFREICLALLKEGQIEFKDTRDNNNETLCLTMI